MLTTSPASTDTPQPSTSSTDPVETTPIKEDNILSKFCFM